MKLKDLARAVKQSLIFRGEEGTGFGMAWQVCLWSRMYDGEKALKLFRHIACRNTYGNLFSNCFTTLQVDGSLGITAGIAEMLLQSHMGWIHLLPALPDSWSEGKITGWRARGAFELDFSWSGGKLDEVKVRSLKGNELKLRYNDKQVQVSTKAGTVYNFDSDLKI